MILNDITFKQRLEILLPIINIESNLKIALKYIKKRLQQCLQR